MTDITALLIADLHLSHTPPVARSEENWYAAMGRQLDELKQLQREHQCPVLCGGDVFDKWTMPPELINFALDRLPTMYAVAGNHDLKHGNYTDIHKTAYWTLVEAGKIINLEYGKPVITDNLLRLHGFPHGFPVQAREETHDLMMEIAVVHAYVWCGDKGYAGVENDSHIRSLSDRLKGYDVAVFGDNHKSFYTRLNKTECRVWNCGGFYRRKIDERENRPCIGLLKKYNSIVRHFLDVSQDRFLETDNVPGIDASEFIEELSALSDAGIDFKEAIRRVLEKASDAVKEIVLEAMEQ